MAKFMPAIAVCSAWKGQDERLSNPAWRDIFFHPTRHFFHPTLSYLFAPVGLLLRGRADPQRRAILGRADPQRRAPSAHGGPLRWAPSPARIPRFNRCRFEAACEEAARCKTARVQAGAAHSRASRVKLPAARAFSARCPAVRAGRPRRLFAGRCLPPQVHAASLVFRRRCQGKEGPKRRSDFSVGESARGRHVRHQDLTAPAAAACVVAARGGGRRRCPWEAAACWWTQRRSCLRIY